MVDKAILDTDRLLLRRYRKEDFLDLYAYLSEIRRAFSEGTHRIFAECDPCNISSWRLLERLGFVREAHFKQNVYFWKDNQDKPIWKDTFVYSLRRTIE